MLYNEYVKRKICYLRMKGGDIVNLKLYLNQLEELVNIDSGSYDIDGINEIARLLASWYKDLGWHIKEHCLLEGRKLLEISNKENCEYYDVMFVGHMDTVFPKGTVEKRPFRIQEDMCYGPGVGDMKNGDVAMYHVASNLNKNTFNKLNICMLYNPDEEIGSIYSKEKMDEIAAKAEVIVVMESAGNMGVRHCFQRKGSMGYEISFHGQASHAGFMFEKENASAILEMGNYIVNIMALASKQYDTTVNVGTATGGTAGNVVADFAKISVDVRFRYNEEGIRVKEAIDKMIKGEPFVKGVKVNIDSFRETKPLIQSEATKDFVKKLKNISEYLKIDFQEKDRGGISDANHLAENKNAIILDGMGPHGANDHSEKEYGYIPSVEPCVKLLCTMLDEICKEKEESSVCPNM